MARRTEIIDDIESTRVHISENIDKISGIIHQKVDIQQKIRTNPYKSLLVAGLTGFMLANATPRVTRLLVSFTLKTATAAVGAYISKYAVEYLSKKLNEKID